MCWWPQTGNFLGYLFLVQRNIFTESFSTSIIGFSARTHNKKTNYTNYFGKIRQVSSQTNFTDNILEKSVYVCMYVYMYVCMYVCMYAYIIVLTPSSPYFMKIPPIHCLLLLFQILNNIPLTSTSTFLFVVWVIAPHLICFVILLNDIMDLY